MESPIYKKNFLSKIVKQLSKPNHRHLWRTHFYPQWAAHVFLLCSSFLQRKYRSAPSLSILGPWKNPKTTEYLKWKITWDIGKFNFFFFFKNKHVADFDFGSDYHLVVHIENIHNKIFIISTLKLTVQLFCMHQRHHF